MEDFQKFSKEFSGQLRRRRIELGLSQQIISEKVGVQRSYLADVERGARAITLKSAWKLAKSLDIKLSVLILEAERGMSKTSKKM